MNRLLALLVLLLALAGCDSSTDADPFRLSAFDADARLVLDGELRLDFDGDEVTGRWELEGRNGYPTPQPASGAVRGEERDGFIELQLLQDVSDAGFLLEGTFDGDRMEGAWSTVTIAGPVPQGTFEAVRD